MKKLILICSVLFGLLFISQAQTTVNVAATARQTFNGFGISQIPYSCCRDAYVLTPPAKRAQMAALVYTELKSNILRMWLSPGKDISDLYFYRDSIVPEAKKYGVTTFLLAPGQGEAPPADYGKWGRDVADYIKMATDSGLQIDVSGVNNEPGMNYEDVRGWSLAGMAIAVKEMRTRLDSYGLSRIGIVAPEGANSDSWCLDHFNFLKGDIQAWSALRGVASHSYGFSITEAHGQVPLTGNKEYWMTEASDNGKEDANNSSYPYSLTRRFLNDLNHGATHWIYFIGYFYEASNADDGRTKMVNYDPNTGTITAWPKYWYMKHALAVFPYGTIFRHSTSPTKGEMNQNGSDKSNLNVAAGRRPDGKFAIAVTSDIEQAVTINVAELNGQNLTFQVLKSSIGNYQQPQSNINTTDGSVTINIGARELITLTTLTPTSSITVTSVSLSPSTASVYAGSKTTLTATVAPSIANNKTLSWLSSNTMVATVNTTGVVTGVAAGSATITVTTQDGNKTATCGVVVTTDTEAPSVPTGLAFSALASTSFTLSWTASTDNAGVASYDVYKAGELLGNTTSTSLNVTGLTALTAYSMTVKAKDAAGNISAYSSALLVTTSPTSNTTKIDDRTAGVTFNGPWNKGSGSAFYQGTETYTNVANAYCQYTYTGTSIKWYGAKNPAIGIAKVYIDDILDSTVDGYNATNLFQQVLYSKTGLSQASHTIKIVVTATKNVNGTNFYQQIDALEYSIGSSDIQVLPIMFISFNVITENTKVKLSWSTASEINSKNFKVQRSLDGSIFETIMTLPAAGNSNVLRNYSYDDFKAIHLKGRQIFYRVLETDFDERTLLTDVKSVQMPADKNVFAIVYNPVRNEALLKYECSEKDKVMIRVMDNTGRTVAVIESVVNPGINQIKFETSRLESGIYEVALYGKSDHLHVRMIKE